MAHGPALALVAVTSMLVGAPPAAAAPASVTLTRTEAGLWTAPVRSDARARPWHFLVDTGSTHTVLAEAAARRAGLDVVPGRRLLTPAGIVEVGETTLPALRIGERVRTGFPVLVADLAALGRDPEIDGILGMDALAGDRVLIDLAGGRLAFVDAHDNRAARGILVHAREVGGRVVLDALVDGLARTLVLDTGAETVVMFDRAARGVPVTLGTAGGATAARAGRADLAVGALRLGAVPTMRVATTVARAGSDGLLPASLFTSIYLDRAAGEVRLVPRR